MNVNAYIVTLLLPIFWSGIFFFLFVMIFWTILNVFTNVISWLRGD